MSLIFVVVMLTFVFMNIILSILSGFGRVKVLMTGSLFSIFFFL